MRRKTARGRLNRVLRRPLVVRSYSVHIILFLDQKAEYEGAAREIHKASCADCAAVEIVLSD
ncbi:hypothetical protein HMPREF7215_1759 [Pyramidobacter piscolens W5455]|uniref:Uncharacterized protein n=1 Tax=Pyramidobacter piscolens W5455 TaxID=352165 RepID=A0ABP2HX38_9BACT|nr:hypothetical protein HMPREF7215_1759 [Pyramidobacter piscolens W5455]